MDEMEQYILLHFENYKDILYAPLKGTQRIKYTCFDVSKSYIVYGATSGGLYVFSRNTNEYLQLIPTTEGSITYIALSDNEKFIAFTTKKNIIGMIELCEYGLGRHVTRSDDLSNYTITTIRWSADNSSLFIGTSVGKLAMLSLTFLNKTIFYLPAYILMELDSTIVQLDRYNEFVLVSTLTKVYLCDTVKNCYKQIGEKLRNGSFGACFLSVTDSLVKIFAARPASRLWEVDLNCVVHSTQEYKQALATAPSSFVSLYESRPRILFATEKSSKRDNNNDDDDHPKQSLNFPKLQAMLGKFIVAFKPNGGLYVFNVEKVNVLFWTNYFQDIVDVKCVNNAVYVWTLKGELHKLQILSLDKLLLKLYFKGYYVLCLEVIDAYRETIFNSSGTLTKLHPLLDMEPKLLPSISNDRLKYTFSVLAEKIKNLDNSVSLETSTGMHVVRNKHLSMQLVDETLVRPSINNKDVTSSSSSNNEMIIDNKNIDYRNSRLTTTNRNHSDSFYDERNTDLIFSEIGGLYHHVPFASVESYSIIQESLGELGTSVSEILGLGSKNVKEKLDDFKNSFINNNNTNNNKSKYDQPCDDAKDDLNYSVDRRLLEDDDDDGGGGEIIVESKSKPFIVYECNNTQRITSICRDIESSKNDQNDHQTTTASTTDLLNEIIAEYSSYCSYNGKRKSDDSSFPFSMYFSKSIIDIIRYCFNDDIIGDKPFLLGYIERNDYLIGVASDDNLIEQYYPFILSQVYSLEDLKLDMALRKLLTIFSHLLDPFAVVDKIRGLNLPCYYACFTYILGYFKNGDSFVATEFENPAIATATTTTTTNNNNSSEKDWPLPVFMNSMLLMLTLDQEQVFCQMGLMKNLNLCDFSYLMLSAVDNDNNDNNNDNNNNNNNNRDSDHYQVEDKKKESADNPSSDNERQRYRNLFLEYLLKHLTRNPNDIYLIFSNQGVLCHTLYELSTINNNNNDDTVDSKSNEICCEFCWLPIDCRSNLKTKYDKVASTLVLYFWTICEKLSNGKSVTKVADLKFLNVLSQLITTSTTNNNDNNNNNHNGNNAELCYVGGSSSLDCRCCHKLCETAFDNNNNNNNDNNNKDTAVLSMSVKLICSICRKYPSLWNYVRTLQKNSNQFKMLSLEHYVQFGYSSEINKYLRDFESVENVVNLNLRVQEGYCLNCSGYSSAKLSLSWNELSVNILYKFGVRDTLQFIQNIALPSRSFNKRFFQSVILSLPVEGYGLDIQKKVVSAVSDLHNVSPVSDNFFKQITKALTESDVHIADNVKPKSSRHHWGLSIDMSRTACSCCSLPLFSQRLIQEENGGIVAFSCGHCYHTICLKHKNSSFLCRLCNSNYTYS